MFAGNRIGTGKRRPDASPTRSIRYGTRRRGAIGRPPGLTTRPRLDGAGNGIDTDTEGRARWSVMPCYPFQVHLSDSRCTSWGSNVNFSLNYISGQLFLNESCYDGGVIIDLSRGLSFAWKHKETGQFIRKFLRDLRRSVKPPVAVYRPGLLLTPEQSRHPCSPPRAPRPPQAWRSPFRTTPIRPAPHRLGRWPGRSGCIL